MGEPKYLHFSITGEYITNAAREMLFVNKNFEGAIRLLRSSLKSDQLTPDEQLMYCLQVLHGSMSIEGMSGTEDYGIVARDDIDERPTNLGSIGQLIKDMAEENERLKKEKEDLLHKFSFLAEETSIYKLKEINEKYADLWDEPMFSDMPRSLRSNVSSPFSGMLESFIEQRKREDFASKNADEEPVCDYGWLEPDGTFHPVEWGAHERWAGDWLNENMPFKEHPEIYWWTDKSGNKHHIVCGDVLRHSLGWILLDNPYQGLAQITRDESRNMTKAQKEFLFDYFMERGREQEANALYED